MVHQLHLQPKLLHGVHRVLVAQLFRLLVGDEHKVVLEEKHALLDTVLLRRLGIDGAEVDNEALLNAEDGVGGFVGVSPHVERAVVQVYVSPGEGKVKEKKKKKKKSKHVHPFTEGYLRDQVIPTLLLKHEVQMRRPPAVPIQHLQELADGAIVGDGIAHGLDALEPEPALLVGHHDGALARLAALGMLHVVVAGAVGLPDVDLDARHGIAGAVSDGAEAEEGLTLWVGGHVGAVG